MIKILYIASTLEKAGPNNQLLSLIKNLDKNRYSIFILTLSKESKNSLQKDFINEGAKVYFSETTNRLGILSIVKNINAVIEDIKPQIVHSHGIRADFLNSVFVSADLRVATVHNFPQRDYPLLYGTLKGKLMSLLHAISFKRLDVNICCSLAVERNLNNFFSIKNTLTVQNGVDTEKFFPTKGKSASLRSENNIPNDAIVWILSGHLIDRKDPLFCLKNWISAFGSLHNHCLLVLGDGPLYDQAKNTSAGYENIKFLGAIDNVESILQNATYYISTSKAEGLPLAALEAMACGLPVLLSDIEPHKELVGKCGMLYKLNNRESFIDAANILIKLDYSELSAAAITNIHNNFSSHSMTQGYENVYKRVEEI